MANSFNLLPTDEESTMRFEIYIGTYTAGFVKI